MQQYRPAPYSTIYVSYDRSKTGALEDADEEGSPCIEDVIDEEIGIRRGCKLSKTFGCIFGDLGPRKTYFEGHLNTGSH